MEEKDHQQGHWEHCVWFFVDIFVLLCRVVWRRLWYASYVVLVVEEPVEIVASMCCLTYVD